jgi:hypothetical protein
LGAILGYRPPNEGEDIVTARLLSTVAAAVVVAEFCFVEDFCEDEDEPSVECKITERE